MKISSLAVIDGIDAAWRRCIVASRLVCEIAESECAWIQQRWGESPSIVLRSRCRIKVFDVFMASYIAVKAVSCTYILVRAWGSTYDSKFDGFTGAPLDSAVAAVEVVAPTTLPKFALKWSKSSSPGFWDDVLALR